MTRSWGWLAIAVSAVAPPALADGALEAIEYQITSSPALDTTPTLGDDGTSAVVVYTSRPYVDGTLGDGWVYYQRLGGEGPIDAPVLVSEGDTNDMLNDVSGSSIVYTALLPDGVTGSVRLYDIATATSRTVATASTMRGARISGDAIVWEQGGEDSSMVMLYEIGDLGSGLPPAAIAGPLPAAVDPDVGDRFAVWVSQSSAGSDIHAYELATGEYHVVAATAAVERFPSTDGPWVVWQSQDAGDATRSRIEALNLDSGERRVVFDNGALNLKPTVSGDLVAFDSDLAGSSDVWLYRIGTGETFQITNDPADQVLNNVHGDLVSYCDRRTGNFDVYVSDLGFAPPDPCAQLGGDEDGDGVCTAGDDCPAAPNPDQLDGDGDGAGDACDACPSDPLDDVDGDGVCGPADNCLFVANADQLDGDGDGAGDACDECPADPTNDADGDGICGAPVSTHCSDGQPPDACGACLGVTVSAGRSYAPSRWRNGEQCLCRTALLAIPESIEVTRGSAGGQWADLFFVNEGGRTTRCRYRGDGKTAHGKKHDGGDAYLFVKCEGRGHALDAGDLVPAIEVRLVLRSGDKRAGTLEARAVIAEASGACE